MSSRTRTRTSKTSAGVHTVRIPRRRGRRAQPLLIVVPERPSMIRQALAVLAGAAWVHRRALAPTALAVLAFVLAAVLHVLAWWSSFLPAAAVVASLAWLAITQRTDPVSGSELACRVGLVAAAGLAASWMTAAAAFGPTTGPLELLWLLALLAVQTAWLIIRRTSN